jgi:hypothetical protein
MYVRYVLAVLAGAGALVVGTVLAAAGPAQATGTAEHLDVREPPKPADA